MSPDTVANFFAIALLGAAAGLFFVMLFAPQQRSAVAETSLPLAALIAIGATGGSLYFSEVAGFTPCELCWFQRIAMYPLAVLLPLAALRRDRSILRYGSVLASIGLAIAAYHVQLQLFRDQSSFCEVTNPCTASLTKGLGFLTIPQMSAISFALIIALALLDRRAPEVRQP